SLAPLSCFRLCKLWQIASFCKTVLRKFAHIKRDKAKSDLQPCGKISPRAEQSPTPTERV
ncbi:MAG: hypothetical protein RR612_06775, partial [Oscillospiraceae bacterium]